MSSVRGPTRLSVRLAIVVQGPEVDSLTCRSYLPLEADSQLSTTRETGCEVPRSRRSHCGSENALLQRVDMEPSMALSGVFSEFSDDDAAAPTGKTGV